MSKYNNSPVKNGIPNQEVVNSGMQLIQAENDKEATETWLREFLVGSNTYISYRQIVKRFSLWCNEYNLKFNKIKRDDIQGYEEFLQDPSPIARWCGPAKPEGHPDWKPFIRGLSPSSIGLNLRVLSNLFDYLVYSGYLINNPFRLYKRKNTRIVVNKGVERYLTHKEWQYIVDYIANLPKTTANNQRNYHQIHWIFTLLYLTGFRRSEISKAKMSDFFKRQDSWWIKVIGKGNKYGEVPVTNDLLTELIQYRKFLQLTDFPNPREISIPLVCSLRTKNKSYAPISDSMLYKLIKSTCRDVAESIKLTDPAAAFVIEQVSTHWLRHTSATHQVDAGIDIRVVKENLRHSMLETTMKYQHTEADKRHLETNQKFGIKK